MDITECLAGSEVGIKIISFCLECDLRSLEDVLLKQLIQSLRSLAIFQEDGRAFINEPIGIFILFSWSKDCYLTNRILEDRDPTQDYWQLA